MFPRVCECENPACPVHPGINGCHLPARWRVYRKSADRNPIIRVCEECCAHTEGELAEPDIEE